MAWGLLNNRPSASQGCHKQIPWQVWKKWWNLHLWLSWPLLASITMVVVYYDSQQSNHSLIGMVYYRPTCLHAIFKINSTLKNINVKTKTRLHLFDHLVRPIACYGSEVWGSSMYLPANKLNLSSFWEKAEKLPIEQLHLRYLKMCLGVDSKAINSAVKGEVGRFPLILHIAKSMLKYWSHMTDPNYVNPLLKEACDEALLLENTPGTWAYSCNKLCDLFQYKWTGNAPNDREINAIIANMKKSYIEIWKRNVGDPTNVHGKLSTYRKLKTSFTFENYLDTVTVKKYRASMTAFRISAHKLEIERLRYTKSKIPRNEWLCTLCTNNSMLQWSAIPLLAKGVPYSNYLQNNVKTSYI